MFGFLDFLKIVFLFSILFISTLVIIISFFLLALDLICTHFSSLLRCMVIDLSFFFLNVVIYIYKFSSVHWSDASINFGMLYFHFHSTQLKVFSNLSCDFFIDPIVV